jgi:dTDP-4-amino-4,6-dideoxygalactose transaminase
LQRIQEQLPLPLAIEVRQQLKQFVLNYWRFLPRYGVYLRPWIEWMGASTWMESTTQEEIRGLRPSGYGKRMPNALAMLGLQQLIKLEHLNAERRRQASYWTTWAQQYGYGTPVVIEDSVPVFLRYPFLVPDRMKMDRSWGTKMGIDVGVWYSDFLHPQGSWQIEPGEREELVAAKRAVEQCVNLPTLKMLRKEVLGAFQ